MTIDVLDLLHSAEGGGLELVRLGQDETALIFFTSDVEQVTLHYCEEVDIGGYIHCAGDDCTLCRIGRKRDERVLLPAYSPTARQVQLLPVSRSLRPQALLPQLAEVLKSKDPQVCFIRREGFRFFVSISPLPADIDAGAAAIEEFLAQSKSGTISLAGVYPTLANEQLREVPEIARRLKLKGLE